MTAAAEWPRIRPGASRSDPFRVLETFGQTASPVQCRLETGRTHQIRIHLAEIGHPVVGDPVYRPRTDRRFPVPFGGKHFMPESLRFVHPFSHESIDVRAPCPRI